MAAPSWVTSSKVERDAWVAAGSKGYFWGHARTHEGLSEDERYFVENRDRATTIAESGDPEACYSFDDYALCELDGRYYIFNTSGCSCPSRDEVWDLSLVGTREEVLRYLEAMGKDYAAGREFRKAVQDAGWTLTTHEPGWTGRRSDW